MVLQDAGVGSHISLELDKDMVIESYSVLQIYEGVESVRVDYRVPHVRCSGHDLNDKLLLCVLVDKLEKFQLVEEILR